MPTVAQIESADPLSAEKAGKLIARVLASETYRENAYLYPDVISNINALVDVTTPADKARLSRHLSAIVDDLDALGGGTFALKGGKDGVDISDVRDREDLIQEALGALLYTPADASGGVIAFGQRGVSRCCHSCGFISCRCGGVTVTY